MDCFRKANIFKIGEICDKIHSGGTPSTRNKEEYYGGNIPWLRSGEINFNSITNTEMSITELAIKNSSAKWIRNKSVLIALTGATVARSCVNEISLTANQSCCALETNESIINYKYLYYYLASKYFEIKGMAQGALTSLNLDLIKKITVPVPKIKVQEEIVKILDSFTNLIDALNEELSLRQKQFEYYREKVLTFDEGDKTTQRISMDELFYFKNGYTPSTKNSEYWTNGKINWFTVADFKNNNILYNSIKKVSISAVKGGKLFKPNSILLATTATIGIHALVCTEHLSNQQLTNLSIKEKYVDEIDVKYIYYYMYIIDEWCKKNYHGGGFMIVDIAGLKKMSIPIPSLAIQQSIVEKLDAFESLISSLKEEIALRQKQYEYYREKLLTFE